MTRRWPTSDEGSWTFGDSPKPAEQTISDETHNTVLDVQRVLATFPPEQQAAFMRDLLNIVCAHCGAELPKLGKCSRCGAGPEEIPDRPAKKKTNPQARDKREARLRRHLRAISVSGLPFFPRICYAWYAYHANETSSIAFPYLSTIAREAGTSAITMRRARKVLVKNGWLEPAKNVSHWQRSYRVMIPPAGLRALAEDDVARSKRKAAFEARKKAAYEARAAAEVTVMPWDTPSTTVAPDDPLAPSNRIQTPEGATIPTPIRGVAQDGTVAGATAVTASRRRRASGT